MTKHNRAPPALTLPTAFAGGRKEKSSLATQEEFSTLYQSYVDPVFRYLYSRVNSAQDAEDLTSQTFLQAYRSYPSLRDQKSFAPPGSSGSPATNLTISTAGARTTSP